MEKSKSHEQYDQERDHCHSTITIVMVDIARLESSTRNF